MESFVKRNVWCKCSGKLLSHILMLPAHTCSKELGNTYHKISEVEEELRSFSKSTNTTLRKYSTTSKSPASKTYSKTVEVSVNQKYWLCSKKKKCIDCFWINITAALFMYMLHFTAVGVIYTVSYFNLQQYIIFHKTRRRTTTWVFCALVVTR